MFRPVSLEDADVETSMFFPFQMDRQFKLDTSDGIIHCTQTSPLIIGKRNRSMNIDETKKNTKEMIESLKTVDESKGCMSA